LQHVKFATTYITKKGELNF